MVALPTRLPAFSMPHGDIIQRRIDANRAAAQRLDYRTPRRVPLMKNFYPMMPWLLQQEELYWQQVEISQPHHAYKVRGELPHNWLGNTLWKVVSFIGSFFDAWHACRA